MMQDLSLQEHFSESRRVLLALLAFMAAGYFLLGDLMGGSLWAHEPWDSYTLQTWNWLQGRTWIAEPENYDYLELAIYQGRYYVSFPPLPSVVLLPLVSIFGLNTPNNLLMAVYGFIAAALAYVIMLRRGRTPRTAAFWALFCVWGSNMLWMTTNGGVWFQAQALNMIFCLAAVLAAQTGHHSICTTLLALAVGCRPLSALFLPVFFFLFAWEGRREAGGFWKSCLRQRQCVVWPLLIGLCYMAYNYARFHDPLEFGHNYLPEFTGADYGQFSIRYLPSNLLHLFFAPVTIQDGKLSFPLFQGFMFYVANPLFIVLFVQMVGDAAEKNLRAEGLALLAGMGAVLLLTCMHRTLGGWQFGARYTCDLLPFAYMYLADRGDRTAHSWQLALGGFAVAFNAYGTLTMYQNR